MADNAQSRYEKTEPDLLAYIETIPNKTKYIKDLIREDMKRKGL